MGQEYGCSHRNPCFVHRPHSNCCDRYHNTFAEFRREWMPESCTLGRAAFVWAAAEGRQPRAHPEAVRVGRALAGSRPARGLCFADRHQRA